MAKDNTNKFLKRVNEDTEWNPSMPDRRRHDEHQCIQEKKLEILHRTIFGDEKPQEGIIWAVKQNTDFREDWQDGFARLQWFVVFSGLASLGTLVIMVTKVVFAHN